MIKRWITAAAMVVAGLGNAAGGDVPKETSQVTGAAQTLPAGGDFSRSEVSAGTEGRELLVPPMRAGVRIAVVGEFSGADAARFVEELNLQQTDFVVTTGNILRRLPLSEDQYVRQAKDAVSLLNQLKSPWYPCVGLRDSAAGMFEKYLGPRYFSVDLGETHVIVLNSEENANVVTFSDTQLLWLAKDLDKAFRRARHVAVVMHRPAWRDEKSNWEKVHKLLVAFGQRPVVAIEGQPNTAVRGGKVDAVFAAGDEYCEDDAKDGIRRIAVGPVDGKGKAELGRMPQYLIARIGAEGTQVSVMEAGHVHGADLVKTAQRLAVGKLEKTGVIGVEGSVEQTPGKESGTLRAGEGTVWLVMSNPLEAAIQVSAALVERSEWKISGVDEPITLKPGESVRLRIGLYCPAQEKETSAPEVVFKTTFDASGRQLELRRLVKIVAGEKPSTQKSDPTK